MSGRMLGVAESAVSVSVAEMILWPNASLGCPQRDTEYRDVPVDGWRVVLEHAEVSYSYHGGGDRPDPFLCWTPDFPPA